MILENLMKFVFLEDQVSHKNFATNFISYFIFNFSSDYFLCNRCSCSAGFHNNCIFMCERNRKCKLKKFLVSERKITSNLFILA